MPKAFDPNALLYRWIYREDDGLPRLIGTDPALADRSKFFRWVNVPHGWNDREPWPQGTANTEALSHQDGAASGWPGAVPLPSAPRGRPRKEFASNDDRPVSVSASVRRAELFEIQKIASEERKSVSEWVCDAIRAQLERQKDVCRES